MKKKIYYHDTDCGKVVYYANYLKYLEEARTEHLEVHGVFLKELADKGTYFVVAHQEADYKAPAFYGDILEIGTKITRALTAAIEYEHEIKNQKGQLICIALATLVCVDTEIKPKAIPEEILRKLSP